MRRSSGEKPVKSGIARSGRSSGASRASQKLLELVVDRAIFFAPARAAATIPARESSNTAHSRGSSLYVHVRLGFAALHVLGGDERVEVALHSEDFERLFEIFARGGRTHCARYAGGFKRADECDRPADCREAVFCDSRAVDSLLLVGESLRLGGVGRPAQNVHYYFEIALAESRFEKPFWQEKTVELGELLPARLVRGARVRDDAVPIKKRSDYFFHSRNIAGFAGISNFLLLGWGRRGLGKARRGG